MGAPGKLTREQLQSPRHADVATALSDALISLVERLPEHGGTSVAGALRAARAQVWQNGVPDATREATYQAIAAALPSSKDRRQFFEAYARMGQLYELAGLVARENTIRFELDSVAPGGINAFAAQAPSLAAAIDALNQPRFEMVMTAHPTNVVSQSSIRQQRDLGAAINAVRMHNADPANAMQALKAFLTTPIIEQDGNGLHNLSVQEETDLALYYLGNLYHDLPQAFRSIDRTLSYKAAEEGARYHPLDFKPQIRFGSWGSSGDKDGNSNVNADTTLDAIAAHTHAILKLYADDLATRPYVELKPWKARIDEALAATSTILTDLRNATKRQGSLQPQQFDDFSAKLTHATRLLDAEGFSSSARSTFIATRDLNMLDLVRKIDTFGFQFAKIEYRENALEYGRVAGALIPDYDAKNPAEKEALLTELLQNPAKLSALRNAAWPQIVNGAGKPYSEEDAAPIAYQTIRRMELARDFPGVVKDNVLAEFEQPHQLLEALLLQKVAAKGGKAPDLGIIPLFESPESMKAAPQIMASAYANPAYAAHLAKHGTTQQIQIAHSDNARRSGLPAARAFIYDAHRTLRQSADEAGVQLQFFEGGSSSDVFRGGVRAVSTAVQNYGLHDFAKFTYQGGDLLNYLNYEPSTKRLFIRNLANAASHFVASGETTPWQDKVQGKVNDPALGTLADDLAVAALKATLGDYQQHAFTRAGLGHLLKELEYDEEKLAGTAGSRAPQRVGFAKVESVQVANAEPVDIFKTRTITFSEALQHGGLVPTMVGARTICENLRREVNATRTELLASENLSAADQQFLRAAGRSQAGNPQLPAKAIQFEFSHSPLFRDVVVRMMIGVSMTDFDQMRTHHPRLENDPFLEQLEAEYREAASLCIAAVTGEYPAKIADQPTADLRATVRGLLPEMEQVLTDKTRYLDVVQFLKADAREQGQVPDDYTRRLMHAAGDTVMHGRIIPVDDPALGAHQRRQHEAIFARPAASVSR